MRPAQELSIVNRRLYRSRERRWLAGVAGGMAQYTGLPVALVRAIWVLLLLPGGLPGLLLYLACWLIIPTVPASLPDCHPHRRA